MKACLEHLIHKVNILEDRSSEANGTFPSGSIFRYITINQSNLLDHKLLHGIFMTTEWVRLKGKPCISTFSASI